MNGDMDQFASRSAQAGSSAELARLLGDVAAGKPGALKDVYGRTSAKLYGISLRLLGDERDAQEVLQDVYASVWSKAGRFDSDKASAITWLATLTRNKAIDRLRQRRGPTESLDQATEVADGGPTALEVLEEEEDSARLAHCLGELDERARTMIRAAFFDGATYPELASKEGVPLPTMKSWIRRGLLRLRGCLER